MNGTTPVCSLCTKPSGQCCSACKSVYYCSKECQKKGWKKHKEECKPYKLEIHPQFGRHFIATRDIKAGEIILKEYPLMFGPKQMTKPVCLGCHKMVDGSYKCSLCNYPLCAKSCETSKWHKDECAFFQNGSINTNITNFESTCPAYECISPIRCLLQIEKNNDISANILNLESHLEEIRKSDLAAVFEKNVIQYAKKMFNWDHLNEEKLMLACCILTTNSFEIEKNGVKLKGLFKNSSVFAHDCNPNTKHSCDDDLSFIWRTTIPVTKGTPLTTTYTHSLWNTLQRRIHLKTAKLFMCTCKRCADPTELETNWSTLICSQCEGRMTSRDPLNLTASWACLTCGHEISGRQIAMGDKSLFKELQEIGKSNPSRIEIFLERYKNILHQNHRFFVESKFTLIRYYGNYESALYKDLSKEQLENKVKWCRELLELANVIGPGLSLLRGNILFELQSGLVAVAKHLFSNDIINEEDTNVYMTEAVKHLVEATEILKHEPQMAKGKLDDRLAWLEKQLDM